MPTNATRGDDGATDETMVTIPTVFARGPSSAMDVVVDGVEDDRSSGRILRVVTRLGGTKESDKASWSPASSASPRSSLLGDALRKSAREDTADKVKDSSSTFRRSGSDESETAAFAEAFAARGTAAAERGAAESVEEMFARAFARDDGDDGCESRHCSSRPIDIPRSESGKGHWKTCVEASDASDARRGDG